jgi:hypothetical protein
MATAAPHPISWQAPRPLWRGAIPYAQVPQLLRFASDDFMEQMIATLEEDPASLSRRIARPETWRTPLAELEAPDLIQSVPLPAPVATAKRTRLLGRSRPAPPPAPPPADQPLKLYQPAHMRHYVVAGSLACAIPGLPERVLAGDHESVGFVLRRLLPNDPSPSGDQSSREFAYVKTSGGAPHWQRVAAGSDNPALLAPGEELLPLFRLAHNDEAGRPRGLWAGVVPVGRREDYLSKSVDRDAVSLVAGQTAALQPAAAATPPPSKTARLTRFKMEAAEPWKAMIRAAVKASNEMLHPADGDAETPDQKIRRRFEWNLQFQMQSWLILLDFDDWLKEFLPNLWEAVGDGSSAGLGGNELILYQRLEAAKADAINVAMRDPADQGSSAGDLKPMATSLVDALAKVRAAGVREQLEGQTSQYARAGALAREPGWPSFHFPLAGLDQASAVHGPYEGVVATLPATPVEGDLPAVTTPSAGAVSPDIAEGLDKLTALVGRALVGEVESQVQAVPFALQLRDALAANPGDEGLFVIRFVHINRDCGPLHPPTVSGPTETFRMANFFDSDAPVRPVRITLPADTSPAGLRKHGRGTAFVLSNMLCGQVQRAKGLGFIDLVRQVLPWPLHKDIDIGDGGPCKGSGGVDIGMICSLSIPIVTLCALILLMIIVGLLDFIFRWLPWFILCFPIPGLKGKK